MNYFFCRFFPGAARLLLQLFAGCVHVRKKRKKNGKTHNQYMLLLAFEFGHSINHRVCVENKWRQYCANRAHFFCVQCTQKKINHGAQSIYRFFSLLQRTQVTQRSK